jgi:hypothetical protein
MHLGGMFYEFFMALLGFPTNYSVDNHELCYGVCIYINPEICR